MQTADLYQPVIYRSNDGPASHVRKGKGTEKNIQKALQYYKHAAELGDEDAKVKELEK